MRPSRYPGRNAARQAVAHDDQRSVGGPQPDLVQRDDFSAERGDALWVADFTYLRCWEGVLFFSFVIDVFSRRVVAWQLATHMRCDLIA